MLASSPVLASLSFAPALYDILGAAALLAHRTRRCPGTLLGLGRRQPGTRAPEDAGETAAAAGGAEHVCAEACVSGGAAAAGLRSVLPCSVHPHDATSARLCPTDNGLFERPAAALAYLPARTAHTVANTQRVGPQAKPFRTDGAAALGATAAASTKLCAAATKPAAGTATRGSLPTFVQQEPPPRRPGGRLSLIHI